MGSLLLRQVFSGSTRGSRRDPSENSFAQYRRQIFNCDTFLLHGIAIAQRDRVAQRRIFFAERLEINGHAERRTNFVLPAVSPTDRAAFVVKNSHVWAQKPNDLRCPRDERFLVFEQWKNRTLYRCAPGMKTQDDPRFHFAFIVRRLVF